jgi:hypothetical protein
MNNMTKQKNKNLLIDIDNIKITTDIDDYIYTKDECDEIKNIVKKLSKHIYIDKTYVKFKGSRWKDAFIKEKSWNKLCNVIIDTNMTQNASPYEERFITESLVTISISYMYSLLCKYNYDINYICLDVKNNSKFKVSYMIDKRQKWDS